MTKRTLLSSSQKIKFKITPGNIFIKKLRLKDKNGNLINLLDWDFRAQFIKNFTEEDIVKTLSLDNGITVNEAIGEIEISIPSEVTNNLLESDSGRFTIERCQDNINWQILLSGFWNVSSDPFIDAIVQIEPDEPIEPDLTE